MNQALADEDLPPVFFLINDGSNKLAQQFVDDPRIDLLSFTGSCAVGKKVGANVAARMGRSLLELGGNNLPSRPSYLDQLAPRVSVAPPPGVCWYTARVSMNSNRHL